MTGDVDRGAGLAAARARLGRLAAELETVAVGWATVDLDRAERDLAGPSNATRKSARTLPDDELLGARCRLLTFGEGPPVVLLEPSTEGVLAATLARLGEGVAVEYLTTATGHADVVDRVRANIGLTAVAPGPFGPSTLVLGGSRWGPHLIIVDPPAPDGRAPGAATIGR